MDSILTKYNPPALSDEDIERDLGRNDLAIEHKTLLTQELVRRRMVDVEKATSKLNQGSDVLIGLTRWLIVLTIILAIPILWDFGKWLLSL